MRATLVITDKQTERVVYSQGVHDWEDPATLKRIGWQHRNRIARILKQPVRRYRYEIELPACATAEAV